MMNAKQISAELQEQGIPFRTISHPAVFTAAQADRYVQGETFVRTKNLFLTTSRHDRYYLVLLEEHKRLDTKRLRQLAATPRLTFAAPAELQEKLGLAPGSVSPFGLLNNYDHDVQLFVDQDVAAAATIGCHPNDNTMTTILATSDLLKFLRQAGSPAQVVDL
ncbi:MAG: prolyl-tRNA synthetase associated domain-containing protein [Limosilactobacillus sp.]